MLEGMNSVSSWRASTKNIIIMNWLIRRKSASMGTYRQYNSTTRTNRNSTYSLSIPRTSLPMMIQSITMMYSSNLGENKKKDLI